jgi:hypothetical protein
LAGKSSITYGRDEIRFKVHTETDERQQLTTHFLVELVKQRRLTPAEAWWQQKIKTEGSYHDYGVIWCIIDGFLFSSRFISSSVPKILSLPSLPDGTTKKDRSCHL